ncbi:hypothetical protein AB0883_18695 [Micromonospora sp. NPDC047812]|uniref:hypothetical protein n=1 Tax=Micromonospora sp. NPDC047812 TaxID=3155742 RepID=UPI003455A266
MFAIDASARSYRAGTGHRAAARGGAEVEQQAGRTNDPTDTRSVGGHGRPAGPQEDRSARTGAWRRSHGVDDANTANGTRTLIWDCHGNANQRWSRV